MFMEKIDLPRVTCDLFGVESGFYGCGNGSSITGDKPRAATEAEARAYADFIRRKNGLPDLGKPAMHTSTIGGGRGQRGHFHYVGATFGQHLGGGEYEPGAFSVLFPGANQMRATVTLETLDDAGEVVSSQTMPIEPKKGGVVWSKDDVRKACGPVAKVKAARKAPTVAKRRVAPTCDKRRRAVLLALKLRAELRHERAISASRFGHIIDLTRDLHGVGRTESREDCAAPVAATDAPATAPDAILSDLAAAEVLMRGEGYVAPRPLSMREAFGALYRIARRDKLTGADLLHAACDLTGEPHETFKCWRAARLFSAVTHALAAPEPMRRKLALSVLNGWGHCNPYRAPMMHSPRYTAWQRTARRADTLRKRLASAGRLEYDAGNWVSAVLPLPVTPEAAPTVDEAGPTPTAVQRRERTPAHERAIRRAWAARRERLERRWERERWADAIGSLEDRLAAAERETAYQRNLRDVARQSVEDQRRHIAKQEAMETLWKCLAGEFGYTQRIAAKRRRAVLKAREAARSARYFIRQSGAHYDRAINAEHEAREALAAREDLKRMLAAAEARLAAAEAENAQLWAEIETLTAPVPALAA